jgi:hypothetical protein
MKHALLAGAVLALALPPGIAGAQGVPVYDNANIIQRGLQFIQTMAQWKSQLEGMTRQYDQNYRTANSLAHTNSVQGLASDLSRLSNTVPGSGQVGDLMHGLSSAAGSAAQVSRFGASISTAPGASAADITRRVQAVANIQAIAVQQARFAEQRIAGIQELMGRIDGQPDAQASAALGNRIQAEAATLAVQQQQVAQLQVLQAAQEREETLRQEERGRQSAQQLGQATEWAWGALGQ